MNQLNIYPELGKWRKNKEGLSPISIRFDFDRNRIGTQSIGQSVLLSHWDSQHKRVKKSNPSFELINLLIENTINRHKNYFLKRQAFGLVVDKALVKKYLSYGGSPDCFYQFAESVIQNKKLKDGHPYTDDSKRRYMDEVNRARQYQPVLFLHQITVKWLEDYKLWLQNTHIKKDGKKLHHNSIWKALSFLRMIYNEAVKDELILGGASPFKKFQVGGCIDDLDKIKYLDVAQIDAIEAMLNDSKNCLSDMTIRVGWRFLAMCVSGMRISDAMLLNDMFFNDAGDLEFKPYKTRRHGNKAHIPVISERQSRYLKRTMELPLPIKDGKAFRTSFNDHLNIISACAKIPVHITSHVGRHTMGSFLVDAGVEERAAMSLLGIKSGKVLQKYLHLKNSKLQSEAQKLNNVF